MNSVNLFRNRSTEFIPSSELDAVLSYCLFEDIELPSLPYQRALDTLIGKLVDSGVWGKKNLIYVLAGNASPSFRVINLKSPGTYNLTPVVVSGDIDLFDWSVQGVRNGLASPERGLNTGYVANVFDANRQEDDAGYTFCLVNTATIGSGTDRSLIGNNMGYSANRFQVRNSTASVNKTATFTTENPGNIGKYFISVDQFQGTMFRTFGAIEEEGTNIVDGSTPSQIIYLLRSANLAYSRGGLLSFYLDGASLTLSERNAVRQAFNVFFNKIGADINM